MLSSSREALNALLKFVDEQSGKSGFADAPAQLLSAASLLSSDKALRVAMADSGQLVDARIGLVNDLFKSKLSEAAVSVLVKVASARWSNADDMVDAIEELAARIIFSKAEETGELDRMESEIFAFSRSVETNSELQMVLTNPALPGAAKAAVVRDVLGGRAASGTVALLEHAAANLRGRRVDVALTAISNVAAAVRNRFVAQVRVAIALTDEQSRRMSAALARIAGHDVSLNVVVDPNIVGGVSVRIGDEVIDGSVKTKLDQARRALVG